MSLSTEDALLYKKAVSSNIPHRNDETLPPLFPVAVAIGNLLREMPSSNGTVHARQDVTLYRPAIANEPLTASITVEKVTKRGENRFLTISIEIVDENGLNVVDASSMVIYPL